MSKKKESRSKFKLKPNPQPCRTCGEIIPFAVSNSPIPGIKSYVCDDCSNEHAKFRSSPNGQINVHENLYHGDRWQHGEW